MIQLNSSPGILFVVSHKCDIVGGHLLSAATLAKYFARAGYRTGLLIQKPQFDFSEMVNSDVTLYFSPNEGYRRHIVRPRVIYQLARQAPYDTIIAMDGYAVLHAGWAATRLGTPIVQIHAGGPTRPRDFLQMPGIVVWSQENKIGFHLLCDIPKDFIRITSGRVDFTYFREESLDTVCHDLGFSEESPRILAVSRMVDEKKTALLAMLDQIEQVVAKKQFVQLTIVGDGNIRPELEARATAISAKYPEYVQIRFLGAFRVTPNDLRQADLVIGQARTVIEAVASNVPASVCGMEGYTGLITEENLSELSTTNLTGRNLSIKGFLSDDLRRLSSYRSHEFAKVVQQMQALYDASQGVKVIEQAIEDIKCMYPTESMRKRVLRSEYAVFSRRMLGNMAYTKARRLFYRFFRR